jgi:hypothetical protein
MKAPRTSGALRLLYLTRRYRLGSP